MAEQHTGHQQQANQSAQRFARRFLQCNHRSDLCFHLLAKIAPFLPSTTLTQLAASGIFDDASHHPALINDVLIFQWCRLQQAIADQKLPALAVICQTILHTVNPIQTPQSQILVQFCDVIQWRLNNQPGHAINQLAALENAITLLYPDAKAQCIITHLRTTDHRLTSRLACYRPCEPTATVHFSLNI